MDYRRELCASNILLFVRFSFWRNRPTNQKSFIELWQLCCVFISYFSITFLLQRLGVRPHLQKMASSRSAKKTIRCCHFAFFDWFKYYCTPSHVHLYRLDCDEVRHIFKHHYSFGNHHNCRTVIRRLQFC